MKSQKIYIVIFILLFITEFLIERYLKTGFIRAYIGDLLASILLYALTMIFIKKAHWQKVAVGVLLFCYIVEFTQYINIVKLLGFTRNRTTDVWLGSSFSWWDMLCYTFGILMVLVLETKIIKKRKKPICYQV